MRIDILDDEADGTSFSSWQKPGLLFIVVGLIFIIPGVSTMSTSAEDWDPEDWDTSPMVVGGALLAVGGVLAMSGVFLTFALYKNQGGTHDISGFCIGMCHKHAVHAQDQEKYHLNRNKQNIPMDTYRRPSVIAELALQDAMWVAYTPIENPSKLMNNMDSVASQKMFSAIGADKKRWSNLSKSSSSGQEEASSEEEEEDNNRVMPVVHPPNYARRLTWHDSKKYSV